MDKSERCRRLPPPPPYSPARSARTLGDLVQTVNHLGPQSVWAPIDLVVDEADQLGESMRIGWGSNIWCRYSGPLLFTPAAGGSPVITTFRDGVHLQATPSEQLMEAVVERRDDNTATGARINELRLSSLVVAWRAIG